MVRYNLALAYRGLGRYTAAIESFEAYRHAPEPGVPEERLAAIEEELQELRGRLVRVEATVSPPTASLSVDGRPVEAGGEPLVLDPGPHVLSWSAPGYRAERRELPGDAGGRVSLQVSLEPLREGRLVVESSVPDALVLVDGQPSGTGRASLTLPPGEHWVELRAEGHRAFRRRVSLGPVGTVRLDAALERESAWPWWAWTLAGVGVATVVGVAIGGAVWAGQESPAEPYRGSWGDVQE